MSTADAIKTADVIATMRQHPAGDIDAELDQVFALARPGRTCDPTCAPQTADALLCCTC